MQKKGTTNLEDIGIETEPTPQPVDFGNYINKK